MCGIVAGIWPKGQEPSEEAFARALGAIAHRGPDGRGSLRVDYGSHVGIIGHVRLAHVDIQGGAQPIVAAGLAVAVNGELYDYARTRADLEARGAMFSTRSDSEIVPHLLAEGEKATLTGRPATRHSLAGLRGEWAFAAIPADPGARPSLRAACDASGTKPLRHWASADGRSCIVASEAKALFALGVPREVDAASLRFAMELQYLPFGRTLFRGVSMLPPAHELRFAAAGHGKGATVSPWTDPYARRPERWAAGPRGPRDPLEIAHLLEGPEADAVAAALAPDSGRKARARGIALLLEGAVRRRLPQETSFCTHLSGGLDSGAILALAARASGRRDVDAFTAHFPWGTDECDAAQATADAAGGRLHRVPMAEADLIRAMDQAAAHAEGPSINAHSGAKILIAEAIRGAGHKCALTGEGADEALYGYEHLRLDFPKAERPLTDDSNAATLGVHRPEGRTTDRGLGEFWSPVPTFVAAKRQMGDAIRPALGERLRSENHSEERLLLDLPHGWQRSLSGRHPASAARDLWSTYCMSGYILRGLDDAQGMARGVESRLPFLDPALLWLCEAIPPRDHYGADGTEKGLLREGLAGVLPDDVLARPKRPFMAPALTQTPRGAAWARERLLGGRLASSGLYAEVGLEALLASPDKPAREACVTTLATLSAMMEALDAS